MERAYACLPGSRLGGWLGGILLLTSLFLPVSASSLPTIAITVQSLGGSVPQPNSSLSFKTRSLRVSFRTQEARKPPRYAVMLLGDGYEHWMEVGTTAELVFTKISGGNYTIVVKDTANYCEGRLSFAVETTVFETWWFWLIAGLYLLGVVGVLFYLLFLYRYQQKLRLLKLREHVARDLHDDMGSQLSSLSILSQNVQQLAQRSPELAQKSVEKIGETARQVMDTMSEIVWNVNPENDSLARIVERMKDFGGELFDLTDTELIFETDEETLKATLPMEKRRDFFLIFKEALTNAARYAQASTVLLRTEYHHGTLRLTIRDDGQGFDPAQPPRSKGGNGLKNMRARAEKIGAALEVVSAAGQGTAVILKLPLG